MAAIESIREKIRTADLIKPVGRVTDLVGMVIEVAGLAAPVGSLCHIQTGRHDNPLPCEVVGFRNQSLLIMPYLNGRGVAPGCAVELVSGQMTVPVGDGLLGRVLDGLGRPLDGGPPLNDFPMRPLGGTAPPALSRRRDQDVLTTGIRSVDSMVTTARGQRLGIFSGSGVGKSVMLGMLSRQTSAEVNVLALIGERGREVREFIERDLGPEGLARSVVIVVTSDESAVMRAKGAETAMTIAEDFRARDKNVLFLMDSATRYAMALREIGLAAGEPPTTKGYPPSVFAALPRLCERAGWSDVNAITAFFTVLIEGDDIMDPVGDALRSILDGHIMLSRDLARRGHYPAVDVLGSVSRLRNGLMTPADHQAAARFITWLRALEDNRDLVSIGAYAPGSDPVLDEALAHSSELEEFLKQGPDESTPLDQTLSRLRALTGEA
jgi:flagellum-specific ATP synthase